MVAIRLRHDVHGQKVAYSFSDKGGPVMFDSAQAILSRNRSFAESSSASSEQAIGEGDGRHVNTRNVPRRPC